MLSPYPAGETADENEQEGQCFWDGKGEPDAWSSCDVGHYEEGRHQEEETSGEGVDRGRPDAFNTLEISDHRDRKSVV